MIHGLSPADSSQAHELGPDNPTGMDRIIRVGGYFKYPVPDVSNIRPPLQNVARYATKLLADLGGWIIRWRQADNPV